MRAVAVIFILLASALAETMHINTPYRGELYEATKPFMQELFKRHAYELEFQKLPLKRGLINANRGLDDGDGPRVKEVGKKFPNLIRLDVPILQISIHAHYKDKKLKIQKWQDIKPYYVGVRTGTVIQVNNVKRIDPKEIVYVPTNEKLFELLEAEKVDVVIAERVMSRSTKKMMGLEHLYQSPALLQKEMYLFLNNKHKEKVKGFTRTLLQMKEEGYQEKLKHFYETGEK